MHISYPVVAAKPQWWSAKEHKTAICGCISSCKSAPAPKIEALTKALLTHLARMRVLAGAAFGADVDAGEPAEGQLDAEDEDVVEYYATESKNMRYKMGLWINDSMRLHSTP